MLSNLVQVLTSLVDEWRILLPLILGALTIWLCLPRPRPYPWYLGALFGGLLLFYLATLFLRESGFAPEVVLFYAFSALALLGGSMLLTQQNPARAALSFTLVVLSTSGLFLLLGAPFLMAATIIVYAGAIIVTFLFVIMLAQQAGLSDADARSREPALATFTGFLLLATMLYVLKGYQSPNAVDHLLTRIDETLQLDSFEAMKAAIEPKQSIEEKKQDDRDLFRRSAMLLDLAGLRELGRQARRTGDDWRVLESDPDIAENEKPRRTRESLQQLRALLDENRLQITEGLTTVRLSRSENGLGTLPPLSSMSGPPPTTPFAEIRRDAQGRPELPAENAAYLGRTLFTDYLLPVELGGTLLLIATIAAIAIAQRREPGRSV